MADKRRETRESFSDEFDRRSTDQADIHSSSSNALDSLCDDRGAASASATSSATDPATTLARQADALASSRCSLRQQSPETLFRLRLVEIGLPLVLSIVSILLTLRYPLTEARCYEIKEALKQRRAELAS